MIDDKDFIQKEWPQHCGDIIKILKKSNIKKNGTYLWECEFIKYHFTIQSRKDDIIKGSVLNPQIEQIEFVQKEWPQNCGDTLKIIKLSNIKASNGNYLWECEFIKYPYNILAAKKAIQNGDICNPRIREEEFIKKIWLQNCGDSLRILGIEKNGKWKCEFTKYPCVVFAGRNAIEKGTVLNPRIEEEEFIKKFWPQHCGDILKILNKSEEKGPDGGYLFECEFIKYPFKIKVGKGVIIRGECVNPQIEVVEFMQKEWPQHCGDTLKILNKSNKMGPSGYLFECEFIKYPYVGFFDKCKIKEGSIDNPNLPHKSKETLLKYIKDNFNNKKPTLIELSKSLNLSRQIVGQRLTQYNLQEYIKYFNSNQEDILYFIIKEHYKGKIIKNSSQFLNGKEIDIYLPEIRIGFEYNGNYWHSNLYKDQKYHQNKSLLAKENNIKLFHIWEWEYFDKQNIIESLIKNKIGIFEKKIGASKCKIKELQYKEYAQFCNENHLQGEAGAKVKIGLFYKNELIQIMSFGVPRFTSEYEWEIIRECSKLGYQIIGGKQKLWSYFLKYYNPNSVISYCDFSKFTGESYINLGFKFKQLNKPGFWWYDEKINNVYWRNPRMHKEMKEKGYLQIWDCGQLIFGWNK